MKKDALGDLVCTPDDMRRINERGGVKGWVPVIDLEGPNLDPVIKLTPWWNDPIWRNRETGALGWHPSYKPGQAYPAPPEVMAAIESRIAPEVRTTAAQKFRYFTKVFADEARKFTDPATGEVKWPASVVKDLSEAAWKAGKAGVLTTEEQVELLARHALTFTAHKQKEIDDKHPNLVHPSRGHYAA